MLRETILPLGVHGFFVPHGSHFLFILFKPSPLLREHWTMVKAQHCLVEALLPVNVHFLELFPPLVYSFQHERPVKYIIRLIRDCLSKALLQVEYLH